MTHAADRSPDAPAPNLPARDEMLDALRRRDFAGLHSRFLDLHRAHRNGQLSEDDLAHAYASAGTYTPDLSAAARDWAAAFPKSYPAQVTLGLHLFNRGLALRTMRLSKDIPEENLQGMFGAFQEAHHQMQLARTLDEHALTAYETLIWLDTQQGERAWDAYLDGVQRSPRSMQLRRAMLGNLRTEWGGSEAEMQAFLARPEHDHLTPEQRAELDAIRWQQIGHWRQHFGHDRRGAAAAFERALTLSRRPAALSGLADVLGGRRGRRLLDEAVRASPHDDHLQARRAVAYLRTLRPAGPHLRTLKDCAARGEPYATDLLSDMPAWMLRPILYLQALLSLRGG